MNKKRNEGSMDIRKIIAEASYIEERQERKFVSCEADSRSEERYEAWKTLLNTVPGKKIFEVRLAYDKISEKEAIDLCGGAAFLVQSKLPVWAEIITDIAVILPKDKNDLWEAVSVKKEEIDLVGPIAALLPFLLYTEGQLKKKYPEAPMGDLSDILLKRLYYLCSQAFNAQVKWMMFMGQGTSQEQEKLSNIMEDRLLAGEWTGLFETYPVLAKRIGVTIEHFIGFIGEFLDRFIDKKEMVENHFYDGVAVERIEGIQGEISDLHQKGKSVLILSFDGDRRLVYKPRPMEIDAAWEDFLRHFNTKKSSIKAPRCLDFGNFGFIEYIEHRDCSSLEEVSTYFYNAGALMALLHAFGGNDFHMENIIASGTIPVVVDTETLMIPVARYFGKGGKDDSSKEDTDGTLETIFEKSVIKMGFLPMWQKDGEDKRADYGALTGEKETMKNLPVYRGKKYPGNAFIDEISGGFGDMYRLIMSRRDELLSSQKGIRLFQHCRFRMLIRNSQVYGNLLQHIIQPALLKDGFDYSMKTDRLVNAFLYDAHESIIQQLMNVFRSEKSAVERGDIPIFYGEPDGEGILDEEGMLFDHYFEKSALANATDRISKLDEEDLMVQLQIIEKGLATEVRNVHEYLSDADSAEENAANQLLLSPEELLDEVGVIYSEIMSNRFTAKDGDYSWLSELYDLARSGTSLSFMGSSLYDGLLGMSVFSAARYRITKERDCYDTALHCYNKACRYLEFSIPNLERYQVNLGYSSGVAGFIAGLSLTAEYLELEGRSETAEKLILGITQKMIQGDMVCDVLGGVSGLVLALTREDQWLKNKATCAHVMEILKWCGDHLIEQQNLTTKDGFRGWRSKEASQTLTGLGHGVSGIALALIRLGEMFEEERFFAAAKEAIAYEDSVYDAEAGNWPDFRNDPAETDRTEKKFMGGYCAGAPGIGLARLDGLGRGKDEMLSAALLRDIKRADHFIRSLRKEGRNHLCCGTAGRIDFLIEKGTRMNDQEALDLAHRKISDLILGKQKRGHYNFHTGNGRFYYNPTLFQGTAGVGYEILRFLAPETIRSILI
ncbi:MAG: type 2 lanthipeptide synthetase LanM [Eubacteriales bacterium]|nr:type 2 lanthipeptide synthetase LanM [Eubacteriales bacterium]